MLSCLQTFVLSINSHMMLSFENTFLRSIYNSQQWLLRTSEALKSVFLDFLVCNTVSALLDPVNVFCFVLFFHSNHSDWLISVDEESPLLGQGLLIIRLCLRPPHCKRFSSNRVLTNIATHQHLFFKQQWCDKKETMIC